MGFLKKLFRVAAPVLGAFLGGPIGAFLGGGIGASLGSKGGFGKQFLMGGLLGLGGAKLGGMLPGALGEGIGSSIGKALSTVAWQALGAGGMSFIGHAMMEKGSGPSQVGFSQMSLPTTSTDYSKILQEHVLPAAHKEAKRELASHEALYLHQPNVSGRSFSQYDVRRRDAGFMNFAGQEPLRMRHRGRGKR